MCVGMCAVKLKRAVQRSRRSCLCPRVLDPGSLTLAPVKLVRAYESSPCSYIVDMVSFHGCGCVPDCANKNCGSDGCGGFCGTPWMKGECPNQDTCTSDGTCAWSHFPNVECIGLIQVAASAALSCCLLPWPSHMLDLPCRSA